MPALRISEEAMAALQAHDSPGNVRQLRNMMERTIILAPGDRQSIDVDLLPPEILDNQGAMGGSNATMAIMGSPLREARESFEREYLKNSYPAVLRQHFAHSVLHRDGTFCAPQETQGSRDWRQAGRGRIRGPRWQRAHSVFRIIS